MDPDFLRQAVSQADANILRIILLQATNDPALADMRVEKQPVRGGALMISTLAEQHHAEVRERAFAWLSGQPEAMPPPDPERLQGLMEIFLDRPLSDEELAFASEELALEDFPRNAEWTRPQDRNQLKGFKVLVIGAGISGIAAGLQLKRLGINFKIVDRQNDIGGTWNLNTYPGIRVDTSSFLYQFKFEKRYPWSHHYASGEETRRYLKHLVNKYSLQNFMQFNTSVKSAEWDELTSSWRVCLGSSDGSEQIEQANVLISASGLFSTPKYPEIYGIDRFEGPMFHTTRWDHDVEIRDRRIALIGTGSSGTQLMPQLAEQAKSVTVYQRTPQWFSEITNYRDVVSSEMQWLIDNVPYYWNWYCFLIFTSTSAFQDLQTYDHEWKAKGGLISEANDKFRSTLEEYISRKLDADPVLVKKCTPKYAPAARRLVVDNGWLDALRRNNVELVTDSISEITPKGILTADGTERSFDMIVFGSGFSVSRYLWPASYTGRDGVKLEDKWSKDGARAYLGLVVPKFPNLFIMYGPDGQPRAGGFYSWAEIWARYIGEAIVGMIEGGFSSIDCREDVFDRYNTQLDAAAVELIWQQEGAGGYYVNEHGRSSVNMPWSVDQYHTMVRTPNLGDFELR